jgi:hypothetical protein
VQVKEKVEEAVDADASDARLQSAVVAGISEARQRAAIEGTASSSPAFPDKIAEATSAQHSEKESEHSPVQQGTEKQTAMYRSSAEESELVAKSGSSNGNG